jgi:hypothetical protein
MTAADCAALFGLTALDCAVVVHDVLLVARLFWS